MPVVDKLKQENGKNIWLIGGGQINTLFLNQNLFNKLLIRIVPIFLGKGLPLFAHKTMETIFELLKTETFTTGIVQITFNL